MERKEQAIYLEKVFRNKLFSQAYMNCGESLGNLAVEIGYARVGGRNGYVRDMWTGRVPVSRRKIQRIAELAEIPLQEVFDHGVTRQDNSEIADWTVSYRLYARQLKEKKAGKR